MSEFFNDFNKILKNDLIPILVKYFKEPNNNMIGNINDFLNDPQIFITDLLENFSKNNKQKNYTDIKKTTYSDISANSEYDELLNRLVLIEKHMIQIEKILNEKIEKY